MLGRVLAIALNTYRESVRDRILLGLAGVAFVVALYSIVVGAFTLKNAPRVVSDLGSASISLFSLAVAVIIAATSLHRELEQKTIFPILARPIRRGEYLVGKYLGTLLTAVVFIMANGGLVLLLCAALGAGWDPAFPGDFGSRVVWRALSLLGLIAALGGAAWKWPSARTFGPIPFAAAVLLLGVWFAGNAPDERRVVLASCLLTFLEVGIVAAIATLFASFSTPFLSALLTLLLWVVGRNADSLGSLPVKYFGPEIHELGVALSKVVPNLQLYVPPRPLLLGETVDVHLGGYLGLASVYALGGVVVLLALASFVFRKRDFL